MRSLARRVARPLARQVARLWVLRALCRLAVPWAGLVGLVYLGPAYLSSDYLGPVHLGPRYFDSGPGTAASLSRIQRSDERAAALASLPDPRPIPRPPAQDEAPPADQPTPDATPTRLPSPTRTRRPTRTPRDQTTPTPVPITAGILRLTLSAEPARPVVGTGVTYVVALQNQASTDVPAVLLEVSLPTGAIIDSTAASVGQTSFDGPVLRWSLDLAGNARAVLRLEGIQAREVPEGVSVCALLLSAGSPIEHCGVFQTTVGADSAQGTGASDATMPRFPTVVPGPAPRIAGGAGGIAGWALFLAAAAGLGVWWGRRRNRTEP